MVAIVAGLAAVSRLPMNQKPLRLRQKSLETVEHQSQIWKTMMKWSLFHWRKCGKNMKMMIQTILILKNLI